MVSDKNTSNWSVPEYLLKAQEGLSNATRKRGVAAAELDMATQAWEYRIGAYEDAIKRYADELIERLPSP